MNKGSTDQGGQYYADEVKTDASMSEVKMEVKVENESAPEAVR